MIDTVELADRDRLLVGLRTILDDRRLNDWFAERRPSTDPPSAIQVTYLRYKRGISLTVGLQTSYGPAFGYAVSREARPKLDKLINSAPPGTILAADRERMIMIALPAADRDLPGVRRAWVHRPHTLSYKPQRRWVGIDDRPDTNRVLRCYRPADARDNLARWPNSVAIDGIRTPGVIDHDRRRGVIAIERLDGVPLTRSMGDPRRREALAAAGRGLARWHRFAPAAPTRAALGVPTDIAEQLITLLPDQSRRIRRLADALIGPDHEADLGWCHGDFSLDQLLITEDQQVAILDWDRSGYGSRAVDLANADAAGWPELEPGAAGPARYPASTGLSQVGWRELLDGYAELRQPPNDLDRYRARARFVRAAEPFRRALPDWPIALTANLDRAEELIG